MTAWVILGTFNAAVTLLHLSLLAIGIGGWSSVMCAIGCSVSAAWCFTKGDEDEQL